MSKASRILKLYEYHNQNKETHLDKEVGFYLVRCYDGKSGNFYQDSISILRNDEGKFNWVFYNSEGREWFETPVDAFLNAQEVLPKEIEEGKFFFDYLEFMDEFIQKK